MQALALFRELIRRYAEFGFPFLVAHVLVLCLSVQAWWSLHREIYHLKRWVPGPNSGGSQATRILGQFIAESEHLGAQGFFIPMTDFSDRLDSIIGGKVTELYERINLFLLVGIAGTLFGVFEFAFGSAKVLGNAAIPSTDRVFELGQILSQSLSKAFPVGFVGLGLMFFGQVLVSIWENRLKETVAEATSKALRRRMEVSRSQAQVVANAAATIEKALEPIKNLQEMMTESLGPVVQNLGERLDQSLSLVKAQFGQMETATAGFSTAVADLRGGVTSLQSNTEHLGRLLSQAPEVLGRLSELQSRQENALEGFHESLRTSLKASAETLAVLELATRASQDLPARVLAAAQEALQVVSLNTSEMSSKMAEELRQQLMAAASSLAQHLRKSSETLIGSLRGQTESLQALIVTTGGQLAEVGAAARTAVTEMQEIGKEVLASAESSFAEMGRESSQRWVIMTDTLGGQAQRELSALGEQIRGSARGIEESLVGAARVLAAAQEALKAVSLNTAELPSKMAEELRERLMTAGSDFAQYLRESSEALAGSVRGQTEALQALIATTGDQLVEVGAAAGDAVTEMREIGKGVLASAESSFTEMRRESSQRWGIMTDAFRGQAEGELLALGERIRGSARAIEESLTEAARNWNIVAINAESTIRGPVVKIFEKLGNDLRQSVRELDSLIAQRYPQAVHDVDAFTRGLQQLVTQVQGVQDSLDHWLQALNHSRQAMEQTHRELLQQSSSVAQQDKSTEMVALLNAISDRLGTERTDGQFPPLKSELSQVEEKLDLLLAPKWPLVWFQKGRNPPETREAKHTSRRPRWLSWLLGDRD